MTRREVPNVCFGNPFLHRAGCSNGHGIKKEIEELLYNACVLSLSLSLSLSLFTSLYLSLSLYIYIYISFSLSLSLYLSLSASYAER
jgi:hypothetical protein